MFYVMQDSKGGGDGFEVQKYGDGRVALIGESYPCPVPPPAAIAQKCTSYDDFIFCQDVRPYCAKVSFVFDMQVFLQSGSPPCSLS